MEAPDRRGPFVVPISQFVVDWNWCDRPARLIHDPPVYEGSDPLLLPSIAAVVHALADRDSIRLPDWVLEYRAPEDVILFGGHMDTPLGGWVRQHAPSACAYHRVWFDASLLDKGTNRQWRGR